MTPKCSENSKVEELMCDVMRREEPCLLPSTVAPAWNPSTGGQSGKNTMAETNNCNFKAKKVLGRKLFGSPLHSEASGSDNRSLSGVCFFLPVRSAFHIYNTGSVFNQILLASLTSMFKACIWITDSYYFLFLFILQVKLPSQIHSGQLTGLIRIHTGALSLNTNSPITMVFTYRAATPIFFFPKYSLY